MEPINTATHDGDNFSVDDDKNIRLNHPSLKISNNRKELLWEHREKSLQLKINLLEKENKRLRIKNQDLQCTPKSEKVQHDHSRLFSIISHDLRSPLSSILDLTKFVIENPQEFTKDELIQNFKNFETSFDRTYRLVDNMLHWSSLQIHHNEFEPDFYSLSELVKDNINVIKEKLANKEISITNKTLNTDIFYGDYNMAAIVLRNLLYNAIKFTDIGGQIEISTRYSESSIIVYVKDNGRGIPSANQGSIFDRMKRLTTTGTEGEPGTGIGLSLCYDMIEQQGGNMGFESVEGEGSTFYFTLPNGSDV